MWNLGCRAAVVGEGAAAKAALHCIFCEMWDFQVFRITGVINITLHLSRRSKTNENKTGPSTAENHTALGVAACSSQ